MDPPPLTAAADANDDAEMRRLIAQGYDVETAEGAGILMVMHGNLGALKLFAAAGGVIQTYSMTHAAARGHLHVLAWFMERGGVRRNARMSRAHWGCRNQVMVEHCGVRRALALCDGNTTPMDVVNYVLDMVAVVAGDNFYLDHY